MPSIIQHSCGDFPEYGIDWHGEKCRATSRHRDGWLRWFFATVRCDCPCHKRAAGQATKAGRES